MTATDGFLLAGAKSGGGVRASVTIYSKRVFKCSNRQLLSMAIVCLTAMLSYAGLPADAKEPIPASDHPLELVSGQRVRDFAYQCGFSTCHLGSFMKRNRVCALLVMKERELRMWEYSGDNSVCKSRSDPSRPNGEDQRYGFASVTKSITSTLLGLALMRSPAGSDNLDLEVLDDPVTDYVTELKSDAPGGYADVPIDMILRMRSGVKYDEYGQDAKDFKEGVFDEHRWSAIEYLKKVPRVSVAGKPIGPKEGTFNYAGVDAEVIGLLIERLSGAKLTTFIWNELWDPLGMKSEARWRVDSEGTAAAFCCFYATAPDLLRFGQFALDRGKNLAGAQVLPAAWFDRATKPSPSSDDTIPSDSDSFNGRCPAKAPTSYRYQWWTFPGRDDFMAIGIDGQFIHIYPAERIVIVQISDWADWSPRMECEVMDAHAAIVHSLQPE